MKRLASLCLLLALCLPGCIVIRGGHHGTLVDAATGEPIPGLEVYYYLTRTSNWQDAPTSARVMDTQVARTNRLGDFTFDKNWMWLFPFVQNIGDERIIVNTELRPDVLMRFMAPGEYVDYWTKPEYLSHPNPDYEGVMIDVHRAQPDERILSGSQEIGTAPGGYVRFSANQQDLQKISVPRTGENAPRTKLEAAQQLIPGGSNGAPQPEATPAAPAGSVAPAPAATGAPAIAPLNLPPQQ